MKPFNIDKISDLLREASAEIVLPRFRALEDGDIERKVSASDPNDIVTVVDREVEEWLTGVLRGHDPSVAVVGEEGAYADPTLLHLLDTSVPLWLLDPIDGTKNFARGEDAFGMMLARVQGGETIASWIYLPVQDEIFAAEIGSGAFHDGARVRCPSLSSATEPRGALHLRYMPGGMGETLSNSLNGKVEFVRDLGCAAIEYTRILMGEREFSLYYRLHPWDHAPGALLLSEAGGRVEHLDGSPYTPRSSDQVTVVAQDPALAEALRGWLRDEERP